MYLVVLVLHQSVKVITRWRVSQPPTSCPSRCTRGGSHYARTCSAGRRCAASGQSRGCATPARGPTSALASPRRTSAAGCAGRPGKASGPSRWRADATAPGRLAADAGDAQVRLAAGSASRTHRHAGRRGEGRVLRAITLEGMPPHGRRSALQNRRLRSPLALMTSPGRHWPRQARPPPFIGRPAHRLAQLVLPLPTPTA